MQRKTRRHARRQPAFRGFPWTAAAELTDTRAPKLTVSQCAERAGSMFAHPDPFWFILSSD